MKHLVLTTLLSILLISCAADKETNDYLGKWTAVKKINNEFVIIDCGYPGASLSVSKDSVLSKGVMEDFTMPIDHINALPNEAQIYNDKAGKTFYSFTWQDKQKGIAKWTYTQEGLPAIITYYVAESNIKNMKTVKGTSADCITAEDNEKAEVEDIYKPDFTTKDGTTAIKLIRENCIELIDVKTDTALMDKCFDDVMIQIRPVPGNALPLTFISGKHYIDFNFYLKGSEWLADEVTIFDPATGSEKGVTKPITIALKDFSYSDVLEKTE